MGTDWSARFVRAINGVFSTAVAGEAPTDPTHLTTKAYVDDAIAAIPTPSVPLLKVATVTMGASVIVGSSAGQLNHASGVELVAASAGKLYVPIACASSYRYSGAAYGGGASGIRLYAGPSTYVDGLYGIGSLTADYQTLRALAWGSQNNDIVGGRLFLRSTFAYTNPGAAAGTLAVAVYYAEWTVP